MGGVVSERLWLSDELDATDAMLAAVRGVRR
jgi:hypothetical protein